MAHFIKNLNTIKTQITDINPNVVIWAFWSLLESKELGKLIYDKDVKPKDCFDVYDYYYYYYYEPVKDVLHIIVDHPASFQLTHEEYVNEIKNIYYKVSTTKNKS